jgi:hypothetical protein
MSAINERIQPGRPTVSELVKDLNSGKYFIDNSYQRRLVWVGKQKVRLIETILMGYPMPEFYLWQQPVDTETGDQRLSVVDGQQRMTSISKFIGGEWRLKSKHLDNKDAEYADKKWSELSSHCKEKIWNYVINIRTIPSDFKRDEIVVLFKRLNETDKSLNPQEIRNAEFDGLFLKASEEVANNPLFNSWNIFSDNEIRRMTDITFASSLLIYQRSGISNDSVANINKAYDLFNEVYEDKEKDLKCISDTCSFIDGVFKEYDEISKFFSSTVHLYSLFIAIDYLKSESFELALLPSKLLKFIEIYKSGDKNISALISQYRVASQDATRSKKSREIRVENLVDWINSAK